MQVISEQSAAGTSPGADTRQALWGQLHEAAKTDAFASAWLAVQCTLIEGATQGVVVLGNPDTGPYAPVSVWPAGSSPSPLLAEAAERTLRERRAQIASDESRSALSTPVQMDGHMHGVVAIETTQQQEGALRSSVQGLQWGCFGLESMLRAQQSIQEQNTRERLSSTLDLVASALVEESFDLAAQALATDLGLRLDCDRVSIGFVRDQHTKVVAVSHSAEFGERMNLIRAIGMAMDESLDQQSIIMLPGREGEQLVTRDHAALTRMFGGNHILTIPFVINEETKGAFSFERPDSRPFDEDTVELCQAVVALCSRILDAKRRNDRSLPLRVKDAWRSEMTKFVGPRHFGRKIAAWVLLGLIVFFSLATGTYRVGANAALEGSVRRVLVAPFDGYVASSEHRAGDVVAEGTVLATLDDRDLRLEYYKWASQQAQYTKQYQEAVAQHDRAQANIVTAQVQQAEAQMNLLADQLARTRISSPFAGLVTSGDLSQSLGTSLKRGQVLFEVAPLNNYRVILEVDETEITNIVAGQKGTLMLSSIPGEVFPLAVTHVTPVAVSREGRSYFRVEALLERKSERMSPGMEGVGKVEIGQRKLFWIFTHKMFDWLRLTFWSWV